MLTVRNCGMLETRFCSLTHAWRTGGYTLTVGADCGNVGARLLQRAGGDSTGADEVRVDSRGIARRGEKHRTCAASD